jgi:hypothetical protein
MTIQLEHEWSVGALIDTGGFGRVYAASSAAFDGDFVAKFIPKSRRPSASCCSSILARRATWSG